MKRLLLITITICLSSISFGQQANFEWAKSFGSANFNTTGRSITVDATGNVYTTGSFEGTVDFDPGAGTFNLTSAGGSDIFIQKLDASGNFLWAKSFGSTFDDRGWSIIVDASGNVYTTGGFAGTVDFDPGAGTSNLTSLGNSHVFIQKLDATGNFLWAKGFGDQGGTLAFGASITVDASGNVYTTGTFGGTVDFDPGAGTFNLTAVGGNYNVFIQKLNASGNFLWAKVFGSSYGFGDRGWCIKVDASGNVYTTGFFQGTVDFDPGAGIFNLTYAGGGIGNSDIFIQKLDASGNFLWAKAFGSTVDDRGLSITVDASGNVYTTGFFEGTVDFDHGAGTFNLTSAGNHNLFIQKLDASGNFLWAKAFGSTSDDQGNSITVDAYGNLYTTGFFQGTVDFDDGAGTFNLTSAGSSDVFIQKLDASGNFLWAKAFGGTSNDGGISITVDASGNVYTIGGFQGTVDFDPGVGTSNLTSVGSSDVFVHKISQCLATGIDVQTSCDSYTWIDGNTYTASNNTATHTLTNAAGCDSVVTLDLTINSATVDAGNDQTVCLGCADIPDDSIALSASGAQTYAWNNGVTNGVYFTPTSTAVYTVTGTDANGCTDTDNVVVIVGARSCVAISISGLDSASYANQTYYQSGLDTIYHTNASGCDSIEYIDITINHTGVNENILKEVEVYPNPTSDIITLKGINSLTDVSYIHLLDNKGALLREIGINQTQINLSSFSTGIYFLEIKHQLGSGRIKVVKQ